MRSHLYLSVAILLTLLSVVSGQAPNNPGNPNGGAMLVHDGAFISRIMEWRYLGDDESSLLVDAYMGGKSPYDGRAWISGKAGSFAPDLDIISAFSFPQVFLWVPIPDDQDYVPGLDLNEYGTFAVAKYFENLGNGEAFDLTEAGVVRGSLDDLQLTLNFQDLPNINLETGVYLDVEAGKFIAWPRVYIDANYEDYPTKNIAGVIVNRDCWIKLEAEDPSDNNEHVLLHMEPVAQEFRGYVASRKPVVVSNNDVGGDTHYRLKVSFGYNECAIGVDRRFVTVISKIYVVKK